MKLEDKVNKWFTVKDLQHAPIEGQLLKLQEEVDELKVAYKEMDIAEIIDAIGDTEVVLHGICLQLKEQHGIEVTPASALESAYDVIKDRTVKMDNKLKVLELFAGTRSIGRAFEERGHEVYSIDYDKVHDNIDWYADLEFVTSKDIIERFVKPDIIWASPDCTTYSIAAISHHRIKTKDDRVPKSDYAKKSDRVNKNVLKLIEELEPKYFFIENPRGALRKMKFMQGIPRYTVTYCQYGDFRMKPTDLWTNYPNPTFRKMCKNGQPCHVSAPRGSKTGTQGIKCVIDRSRIPKELCDDIVLMSEGKDIELKQYRTMDEKG